LLKKIDQDQQGGHVQEGGWQAGARERVRLGPIGPVPGDGEGSARRPSQNQGVDPCDPPGLQDQELLASKRMEWVGNLRPFRTRAVVECIAL